jgi:hypothetical protein
MGSDRAIELAAEATGPPALTDPGSRRAQTRWFDSASDAVFRHLSDAADDPLAATRWRLVDTLTSQFIGESVRLERQCAEIVERVAGEEGWEVRRDVHRVTEGKTYVFDFVITIESGSDPIFIETANFRGPQALSDKVAAISAALPDERLLAAFLVIPNTQPAAAYVPEKLAIVPVGDLERKLREIAG